MILEGSFALFKAEGMASINARSVARALGCSTQPIFSYYEGMDDLKTTLEQRATGVFEEAVAASAGEGLASACGAYVRFAQEEPRLFAHLFLRIGRENPALPAGQAIFESTVSAEARREGFAPDQAKALCAEVWLYAHGLAAAAAAGLLALSQPEACERVERVRADVAARLRG